MNAKLYKTEKENYVLVFIGIIIALFVIGIIVSNILNRFL